MTFLLDTNVCIRYMNGRAPGVREHLQRLLPADVVLCAVVKAELAYGAWRSRDPRQALAAQQHFMRPYRSLPFDDPAAAIAGLIRAELATAGTPIGPYDLLIAAIALANQCTLVTHNVGEFGRVSSLQLVDWEAP